MAVCREIEEGTGAEALLGSGCSIRYTMYRLASGAYFKYSGGGTPVFLEALGYGTEGKNDMGETYAFALGDRRALPVAVTLAMVGMKAKGALFEMHVLTALPLPRGGAADAVDCLQGGEGC